MGEKVVLGNIIPTDFWSQVLNIILWVFVLAVAFPKLIVYQMMVKLEQSTLKLEEMSEKAQKMVLGKISKKPDKKLRAQVKSFMEFFAIPPVDLDPFGIIKKFEFLIDQEKERFEYFAEQIAPHLSKHERDDLIMGISGAMSLYQISKIVRHFLELTKKTKSQYYAMILQMQLPLIEKIAGSLLNGTEALTKGWVIGDGIGPLVAAHLIGDDKVEEVEGQDAVCRKKFKGRDIIVTKAFGPGGKTGNIGRTLEKISKKTKLAKIITIDAAAKLEGERTGTVAEGVGIAMGGIGVERSYIEDIAVKGKIPFDSIIIKMSQEEAIMLIRRPILDATPKVLELVEQSIERTKKEGAIVIIGVGNTSGVGNSKSAAIDAEKKMREIIEMKEQKAKERKKKFRLFGR